MSRRMISALGLSAVLSLALAACGSSAASVAPSGVASVAPSAVASVAPSAVASVAPSAVASVAPSAVASASAASGGAACSESTAAGTVKVSIKDFAFNPAAITAKVGDVITFTNGDSAGHTATLDDGSCFTPTIAGGASDGLTFTAAGIYPFHCAIHATMMGTITVS